LLFDLHDIASIERGQIRARALIADTTVRSEHEMSVHMSVCP
jgi:hypothetical protein